MSFNSQLDTIFRQLRSRLDLRDLQTEPVYVPSQIIPVLEIADLIGMESTKTSGAISITATGGKTVFTVPTNKRWVVHGIFIYRNTGTWTMDSLLISDGTNPVTIVFSATQTRLSTGVLGHPIVMMQGWLITVNIDAYSVTGDLYGQLLYREEDIT